MANMLYMDSMLLIRAIYINLFPLFNLLDQTYLIPRCKCTLATKIWCKFSKGISTPPEKEHRKNCVFDQVKNNKRFMERKWTDRQYHVQDNTDVVHQDVRIYCNTNKFPELPFVVHIPNLMAQEGWVSIIICVLIQN